MIVREKLLLWKGDNNNFKNVTIAGFLVSDSEISYISEDELRKINTEYTLYKAFSIADVDIKNYLLFIMKYLNNYISLPCFL